jgi:AraC-like DNA-binding protein
MGDYDPKGNGRRKNDLAVQFVEALPPPHLQEVVHRYLELRTMEPLPESYRFHALPDVCTYLVFDQHNVEIVGLTGLRAGSEEFDLGREFHFVNVRLMPGVWRRGATQIGYGLIDEPYRGDLPLTQVNKELASVPTFAEKQLILSRLIEQLVESQAISANLVAWRIVKSIDEIHTVTDMANVVGLSTRQLQRTLIETVGLTPSDFLKVIRLQSALVGDYSTKYADQSHFIHSFRRATGYTPGGYFKKFDV